MFQKQRSLYLTLICAWLGAILAATPVFYFAMPGCSLADAFMESAAAWTTTGIGAYDSAEMPLWLSIFRSVLNWIGGVGILMVFISIFKPRSFMGWKLAAAEFPGPNFLKVETDFRMYYRRIVEIYAGLSVLQFVLLLIAGMAPADAVMTALSNTVTAGLHHINNGVVTSLSLPIKIIITVFAFAGSVSAPIYVYLTRRKWKKITDASELFFYSAQILITTIAICGFIEAFHRGSAVLPNFGAALMQVISSLSTSGYVISDIGKWPHACMVIIVLQVFVGACSLSTGGGIKVGRILIAAKTSFKNLYRHVHPRSVRSLTFDQKPIKSEYVASANIFIALFMITYLLGALLLSLDNVSLIEALSYSQAMITNSGISLASLTNAGLAVRFSAYGRTVLAIIMIAGRLEIYPLLMLFFRSFWRSE